MAEIAARPAERANARYLNPNAIILAVEVSGKTEAFALQPSQLNPLIEALIIASLAPELTAKRKPASRASAATEKVLTFPLERISASHAPTKGTVSIVVTLPSGFRAAFEMSPQESLTLSQQLQASAGRAQAPKSTAKH
jgi:hypothetical protein